PHTRSKETCEALSDPLGATSPLAFQRESVRSSGWRDESFGAADSGRKGHAVKALTVIVGALIGIAVSAVVFSFQAALSPFFAFLVLAGVTLWLRDVRSSP